MNDLKNRLAAAAPLGAAHEELALKLAAATPAGPATATAFDRLKSATGAGFIQLALWVIEHPAQFAPVVAEVASGQWGKAALDAIAAIQTYLGS